MDPQVNPYSSPKSILGPDTPVEDYILASRGARLLGNILDGIAMIALIAPMFFFIHFNDYLRSVSRFEFSWFIAIPLVIYAGIQWTLITKSGQSIGKKFLGTKIVRLDGSPCGFVHGVVLRSWILTGLGMIPMIGGLINLIDILLIFRDDQRCGHDLIADTRVIYAQNNI